MIELLWIGLAAAATSMVTGMLWFGPIFGKPWVNAMGWGALTKDELKEKTKGAGPGYAASMVLSAGSALALWVLYDWGRPRMPDLEAPLGGPFLGLLAWAGFYFPGTFVSRFFEGRKWTLWFIDTGYWMVQAVLAGLWVGLFHTP